MEEDIPFNYYADNEDISTYIYSKLGEGYEITDFDNNDGASLFLRMSNDSDVERLVVFDGYVKIYPSREES